MITTAPPPLQPVVQVYVVKGRPKFKAFVEDPATGKVYRQGWFDHESDAHRANVERIKLLRKAGGST